MGSSSSRSALIFLENAHRHSLGEQTVTLIADGQGHGVLRVQFAALDAHQQP